MFSFLKSKKDKNSPAEEHNDEAEQTVEDTAENLAETEDSGKEGNQELTAVENKEKPRGFFSRLKQGLSQTRHGLTYWLANVVLGAKTIDDDIMEQIEDLLITADLGMDATTRISQNILQKISRNELKDPQALFAALHDEMQNILTASEQPLVIPEQDTPFVILVIGINGAGKTTTIGKMAKRLQNEGKSVMLAAGDTFRAAAVEQLQVWGERNNIPVIAQRNGADSASVIYDALESAKSKNIDVLIADTAGRLHTQTNLM